jgi:hypothetical protein
VIVDARRLNLYGAAILFKVSVGTRSARYELRFVTLTATDLGDAKHKAADYAAREGHLYDNADGETVTWEAVELLDLQESVDAPIDGIDELEVYAWPIFDEEHVDQIRRILAGTGDPSWPDRFEA